MTVRRPLFLLAIAVAVAASAMASFSGGARQALKPSEGLPAVRFVAIGDVGTGHQDQLDVAREMVAFHGEHPFDTVLMLGDNIYPMGDPKDLPKKFEQPYADLLRRGVSFYAVLGNHDVFKG